MDIAELKYLEHDLSMELSGDYREDTCIEKNEIIFIFYNVYNYQEDKFLGRLWIDFRELKKDPRRFLSSIVPRIRELINKENTKKDICEGILWQFNPSNTDTK